MAGPADLTHGLTEKEAVHRTSRRGHDHACRTTTPRVLRSSTILMSATNIFPRQFMSCSIV